MSTIWKIPIQLQQRQEIELPISAKVLTVQTQMNNPVMWVEVSPLAVKEKRMFQLYGTGHEIDDTNKIRRMYIGTFQLWSGQEVYHLYEILP